MEAYPIREWLDVIVARARVRTLARSIGFSRTESGELAIVASELGSNIIKYGDHGSLSWMHLEGSPGKEPGLLLVARDFGPPFRDLSIALLDGCDDDGPIDPIRLLNRKGIGGGLGAVVRLTHSFSVRPMDVGKEIEVERYVKARR